MKNIITKYCIVRNNTVSISDQPGYTNIESGFTNFIKEVYNHYKVDYPKFFKMDNLSKLGFMTGELLLNKKDITTYSNEDVAIVIANASSCLDTDEKYYDTIKSETDYFPSPAVFVYTLPNIMIGEISIKYNLKGENAFFVSDEFDTEFIGKYVNNLLDTNKAQCCIAGWVNIYQDQFESILFLAEKETQASDEKQMLCNTENINKIYSNKVKI